MMFDIRDHGGNYGGGGIGKNTAIPSWELKSFVKNIGSFNRMSASNLNDYHPSVAYDKVLNRVFSAAGQVQSWGMDGNPISTLSISPNNLRQILISNSRIFVHWGATLIIADTNLLSYVQYSDCNLAKGIVEKNSKIYCFDTIGKRVLVFNSKMPSLNATPESITVLNGVVGTVDNFGMNDDFFFVSNNVGQVMKFNRMGVLLDTIKLSTMTLGYMYVEDNYLYCVYQYNLKKIDLITNAEVWTYTKGSAGFFSGKLVFDKEFIYLPSSGTEANLWVIKKGEGKPVLNTTILPSYPMGSYNTALSGIYLVDDITYMTHMMSQQEFGFYYFISIWASKLTTKG